MYPLSRSFYYKSKEMWERFIEVTKAEGKNPSRVLGEYIDNYLMGYTDPNIPSITTYFAPNPNSIEAIQQTIRSQAMRLSKKKGGEITLREIREMYFERIPMPDIRNRVSERTAKWLTEEHGVKVWR